MPWTPADAQKHDKSANAPEKRRRWAKIANGVLKRTGNDVMAIRVANSRVEGVEMFVDRVLGETEEPEEKPPEKKEGFFSRVRRGWGEVERASSKDPATRGERPAFSDNPWAHIVHRAAEYQGSRGGGGKSSSPAPPAKPKTSGLRDLLGPKTTAPSTSAREHLLRLQWERSNKQTLDQQRRQAAIRAAAGLKAPPYKTPQPPRGR